jgi:hypothetical protein
MSAEQHMARGDLGGRRALAIYPGFTDTNILTPELKQMVGELGLEIVTPEHVGDAVVLALRERINGAQWVVWPGVDVAAYEWNPALPIAQAAT